MTMIVFKEDTDFVNPVYIITTSSNGTNWIPIIGAKLYRCRKSFILAINKTDIYIWIKSKKYRKLVKNISVKEIKGSDGVLVLDSKYREYVKLLMVGVPLFTLIKERKSELCDLWKGDTK